MPKNAPQISRIRRKRECFASLEMEKLKLGTIESKRNTRNQTRGKPKGESVVNVILDRTSTVLTRYPDLDTAHR